ncbi:MAG: YtxH domain-containing protein [Gemmatimonadales bacterium]
MQRKDENVVLVEREGGSSVLWFLVGGVVGAGLALLFAPYSGDRTRRILGRRLTKLKDAADQALADLKDAVAPVERPRGPIAADREESGGESGPAETRSGVSAARRELEQRLAEARARRHKALASEEEEPIA